MIEQECLVKNRKVLPLDHVLFHSGRKSGFSLPSGCPQWWLFPPIGGFWENDGPLIPHLLFFFFWSGHQRAHTNFTLGGDQSTVAQQWDECGWMFPDKLHVSLFPNRFSHYAWTVDRVSPLWLHWVKGVCVFGCNLPPALFAELWGSFTCHCCNTVVGGHQIRVSPQS